MAIQKKVPAKTKAVSKKKPARKKPNVKKPAKRKIRPVPSGEFFFREKYGRVVQIEVQVTTVTVNRTSMRSSCPGPKCPNKGKKCWKGCLILAEFHKAIQGGAPLTKAVVSTGTWKRPCGPHL